MPSHGVLWHSSPLKLNQLWIRKMSAGPCSRHRPTRFISIISLILLAVTQGTLQQRCWDQHRELRYAELWLKSGRSYIYQCPTLMHPYNWRTTGLNLAPAYNSATELQHRHWVGVMNNGCGLVTAGWSLWVLQYKQRDSTGSCVSQIFPGEWNGADYNQKSKDNSTVSFRTVSDSLRDYFLIPDMNANIIPLKKMVS